MGALGRPLSGNDDMILPQEELGKDRVLQSVGMAAYCLVDRCRVRKGVRGKNRQTSGERSRAVVQIAVVEAQQRLSELRRHNGKVLRLKQMIELWFSVEES